MHTMIHYCSHASGTPCHPCPQMGCMVMERRFVQAGFGEGGIAQALFLVQAPEGCWSPATVILPVLGDGTLYTALPTATMPVAVLSCLHRFVVDCLANTEKER